MNTSHQVPHIWAKEIAAWAEGKQIECRYTNDKDKKWHPVRGIHDVPAYTNWWDNRDCEFRVKPEPVVRWSPVWSYSKGCGLNVGTPLVLLSDAQERAESLKINGNIVHGMVRLEFDPDTGKLISATVETA